MTGGLASLALLLPLLLLSGMGWPGVERPIPTPTPTATPWVFVDPDPHHVSNLVVRVIKHLRQPAAK